MDGILLLNKPVGFTSHDLVLKTRTLLHTPKIGHTGTLDPMAEGLMMLTVGKATKILPYIAIHDKEYEAELTLGKKTDTLDAAGNVLFEEQIREYGDDEIISVLNSFKGKQLQIPPMYSAKKVNGRKLYELARKNVEIERTSVMIEIYDISLMRHNGNLISFKVSCSSGTYVRSLCNDIAEKLGTVGFMSRLIRTRIDRFELKESCSIEDVEKGDFSLLSTYDVLYHYPYIEMENIDDILNGKPVKLDTEYDFVFITHDKEIIASYQREGELFYCKRGLW